MIILSKNSFISIISYISSQNYNLENSQTKVVTYQLTENAAKNLKCPYCGARFILLTYIKRCNEDIRSFGALFEDCKEELQEIHINIALDTLMNTFMDYVHELIKKQYLKKGCIEKALELAYKMLSSWYTQQMTYVKNFIDSIKKTSKKSFLPKHKKLNFTTQIFKELLKPKN